MSDNAPGRIWGDKATLLALIEEVQIIDKKSLVTSSDIEYIRKDIADEQAKKLYNEGLTEGREYNC